MLIVGVDSGSTGAVALLWDDGEVELYDLPIVFVDGKSKLNAAEFKRIMAIPSAIANHLILIEETHAQGLGDRANKATLFSMGRNLGGIEGVLVALDCSVDYVKPATWKRYYWKAKPVNDNQSKERSRQKAIELFPKAAEGLSRKKDHDRAEALLIANYARRKYLGGST